MLLGERHGKRKIKETVKNPEAQGSGTEKRKLKKMVFCLGCLCC